MDYNNIQIPQEVIDYPGILSYKDLQLLTYYATKAKHGIVEIGCHTGKSTLALLVGSNLVFGSNVDVLSIDSFDPSYDNHDWVTLIDTFGKPIAFKQEKIKSAKEFFIENISDEFSRNKLFAMTSDEAISNIPEWFKYDLLFIDGDHSLQQVTKDVLNYIPRLEDDGIIIFHDYPTEKGVRQVVDILDPYAEKYGLCVVIKKEKIKNKIKEVL